MVLEKIEVFLNKTISGYDYFFKMNVLNIEKTNYLINNFSKKYYFFNNLILKNNDFIKNFISKNNNIYEIDFFEKSNLIQNNNTIDVIENKINENLNSFVCSLTTKKINDHILSTEMHKYKIINDNFISNPNILYLFVNNSTDFSHINNDIIYVKNNKTFLKKKILYSLDKKNIYYFTV